MGRKGKKKGGPDGQTSQTGTEEPKPPQEPKATTPRPQDVAPQVPPPAEKPSTSSVQPEQQAQPTDGGKGQQPKGKSRQRARAGEQILTPPQTTPTEEQGSRQPPQEKKEKDVPEKVQTEKKAKVADSVRGEPVQQDKPPQEKKGKDASKKGKAEKKTKVADSVQEESVSQVKPAKKDEAQPEVKPQEVETIQESVSQVQPTTEGQTTSKSKSKRKKKGQQQTGESAPSEQKAQEPTREAKSSSRDTSRSQTPLSEAPSQTSIASGVASERQPPVQGGRGQSPVPGGRGQPPVQAGRGQHPVGRGQPPQKGKGRGQPEAFPDLQQPERQSSSRDTSRSHTPLSETPSQSSVTSGERYPPIQVGRGQPPFPAQRGQPPFPAGRGQGRGQSPEHQIQGGLPQTVQGRGAIPPQQQPQEFASGRGKQPAQQMRAGPGQQPQQPAAWGGRGQPQAAATHPPGFTAPQTRAQAGDQQRRKPETGQQPQQPAAWGGRGQPQAAATPPPGFTAPQAQARAQAGDQRRREPETGRGQQQKPIPEQSTPVQAVTKQLDELAIVQKKNLKSCGTLGRKILVETNHLPLVIKKTVTVAIHYDITITPDKPKRMMRQVWENYRAKYLPKLHPAFDEVKNIYSPTEIPDNALSGEVTVQEESYSRPKEYKVVIKPAARVDLTALDDYMRNGGKRTMPQDALQCLDIVLRNAPALQFVRVGRSYFTQPKEQIILGDGLEMWHGFYQSAILGWKPYLNIDVAHKGFPMELNVIDLIIDLTRYRISDLKQKPLQGRETDTISKFLKGLKIRYELPNQPSTRRAMRVNGCSEIASKATFVLDNGTRMTVYNYYLKEKNYKIQYPEMPCLWVGSRDKRIYYPPELCMIVAGQVTNRKMNDVQTRAMVKNAATPTDVRKKKIYDAVSKARFNDDPCVRAFGLSVGDTFERVPARVLAPPTLQYNPETVVPSRGVWRSGHFIDGKTIQTWTVLILSRTRDDEVDNFVSMLRRGAGQNNMTIGNAVKPYGKLFLPRGDTRPLVEYFEKNKKMELIVIIVPEGDIYSKVKQTAELVVGCLTQCIKERTIFKSLNASTITNILLKINAKLNGHNHKIANICRPKCLLRPCMIMGADVTHPSPDQRDKPSIAAVAASHDPAAFKYNFCWRLQPARQEIITDLEEIIIEQLKFFHANTGFKPESIIFFRDGVSEGQFTQVLSAEVNAIKRACSRMSPEYKPPITFLVVQKRHHTRFFPTNPRDSEDRNMNVPAGTCVDTEIIHPTDLEYYLVSHASIQGVARPTKYRMLWDDRGMSEDEIQSLTYYLCHMFTRCTRSVSYPAPTYYAHLAAFRASVYFEGREINLDNLQHEQLQNTIKQEICKGKPMFFV